MNTKDKTANEAHSEPLQQCNVVGSAFEGTKGKWKVINIELFDYSTCAVGNDKTSVCHLFYEGRKITEEAKANAKLIAAAPNLLEALLLSKEVVKNAMFEVKTETHYQLFKANEIIEKAISKALNG